MKDFSKMTKAELIKLLEQSNRLNSAMDARFYKVGHYSASLQCVAVPLTRDEKYAVSDYAADVVSSIATEGDEIVSENSDYEIDAVTYSTAVEWKRDVILPRFAGLLVRYTYDHQNGTNVDAIYGLLKV